MPNENFHLVFKEQWWCVSSLTSMNNEDLKKKVENLDKYCEEKLSSFKESDLNPKFVPDPKDRQMVIKIANNMSFDTIWKDYIDDFNLEESGKVFNKLGFLLFRAKIKKGAEMSVNLQEIRPNHLQQIVLRIWNSMIKDYKDAFKFDDKIFPYLFSVCTGYQPNQPYIGWNSETIAQYKREIGAWVEVYSGQFEDYRDDVYQKRISVDLSNRGSEMHIIMRNSALLYMDAKNYDSFFIKDADTPNSTGYMLDSVIVPTIRIRTIAFAMQAVNAKIDEDTKNLASEKYQDQDPEIIKKDLEKSNRLKSSLQLMLAPFFADMSRSHRPHYTSVLQRAVELFDINNTWTMISGKIESNVTKLNSLFLDKQQESSERSEKILNLLNFILGAGILFEIIQIFVAEDNPWQGYLLKGSAGVVVALFASMILKLGLVSRKGKKKENKK